MSWEWSHTPEAYETAKKNLSRMSKSNLREIYAEIKSCHRNSETGEYMPSGNMNLRKHSLAFQEAKEMAKCDLVEFIWEFMESFRACDIGGHKAWCCPYGCNFHKVSFG